jgi:hypothetical protein
MQIAFNPQLPPPMQQAAMAMISGAANLARKMLDIYEVQDRDQIIPDINALLSGQPNQSALQPPLGGAPPMGQGSLGPPGLPLGGGGYPGALGPGPQGAAFGPGLNNAFAGAGSL